MVTKFSLHPDQEVHLVSIGDKTVNFIAKVAEIGVQYTAISFPQMNDQIYITLFPTVPEGTMFTFVTFKNDGVYTFSCGFRGCELLPKKMVYFEHPVVDERLQRRSFIRIPFCEEIDYSIVKGNVEDALVKGPNGRPQLKGNSFKKGQALNISAGGMLIRISENVEAGSYIGLIIKFEQDNILTLVAQIMHCELAKDSEDEYIVGIKFEEQIQNSSESLRFSRTLAKLQREWMRKAH